MYTSHNSSADVVFFHCCGTENWSLLSEKCTVGCYWNRCSLLDSFV